MQKVNVPGGSSSRGGGSCLGILTNTVVRDARDILQESLPSEKEERSERKLRDRWKDLRRSGELLPGERVWKCCRDLGYGSDGVVLKAGNGKASFSGLSRCDSVWACPVCAFRIARQRQLEFEEAFEKHIASGASVWILTLTMRHKANELLSDTLSSFKKAVKTFKQRKEWRNLDRVGHVSVTEVTWHTSNGWHPHLHIAIFCERPSFAYGRQISGHGLEPEPGLKRELTRSWLSSLERYGRSALQGIGLDLKSFVDFGSKEASKYMFKWGLDAEMMRGDLKKGKSGSMTPFQLLSASRLKELSEDQRDAFGRLFQAFFYSFKGRKQATWSPGLKDSLLIEEKDDSELEEMEVWEVEWECYIPYIAWRWIVLRGAEAELLILARKGFFEKAEALIDKAFVGGVGLWFDHVCELPKFERVGSEVGACRKVGQPSLFEA